MTSGGRCLKRFPSVRSAAIECLSPGYNLPYAFVPSAYQAGEVSVMKRLVRQIVLYSVLLLTWRPSLKAQLAPCDAGFEISAACITARGLDQKAAVYRGKIAEALARLGASYQISLRLVNHPVEAGYDASTIGDVFTDVVRNEEMRNQSFIINVTANFLERQPEILFEASSLHEVCHIMND